MWHTLFLFATIFGCGVHGVDWRQYKNTNKYFSVHRPTCGKNYWQSERYCNRIGGSLASIHSKAENDFVYKLARRGIFDGYNWDEMTLIGLKKCDSAGGYGWSNGKEVDYTNWQAGEPNNHLNKKHCVVIFTSMDNFYTVMRQYYHVYRGDWNDLDCNRKFKSFVCEKEVKAKTVTSCA